MRPLMFRSIWSLLLASLVVLSACKKEDPVEPDPTPTPPPVDVDLSLTGAEGVRMILDGSEVSLVVSSSNNLLTVPQTFGQDATPPALSQRYYSCYVFDGVLDLERFRMVKGTLDFEAPQVIPDAMYGFFAPATHSYGVATLGGDGVELTYTDATGVAWRTTCANQSASTFTIVEVENGSDLSGPFVTVKADFTATFGNCATGATKTASDGVLVMSFREFF
jgi:hypothetical protein